MSIYRCVYVNVIFIKGVMALRKHILALLGLILIFSTSVNLNAQDQEHQNFYEIKNAMEKHWEGVPIKERSGWKQYKRWEKFWGQRTYPTGEFYDGINIYKEMHYKEGWYKKDNSTLSKSWEPLGPFDQPYAADNEMGIGRVNCLRFHPNDPNELWVGASTGGVWRSKDGGKTWTNFDFSDFLSLGVNDIAISPSDPNVVYVATGDAFGLAHSAMQNYSIGIIKSTNGGSTWRVTNFAYEIDDKQLVSRLLVNPDDPNTVIAATSSGIIKTTDGGNTWNSKNNSAFIIDMEFNPLNHNIIYASTFSWSGNGHIYKSTDNGDSWEDVRTISGAVRIALAVTADEPDFVYALSARTGSNSFHSVQVSDDEGDNWIIVSNYNDNPNYLGRYTGTNQDANVGQGAYDLCLAANPTAGEELFLGGINIWFSNSSGMDFDVKTSWIGAFGLPYVHADIHDLIYSPDGKTIYSTNDGGVYKSTNKGSSWVNLSDGLVISQLYRMGSSAQDPYFMIAGFQDNGTSILENGKWRNVLGGDGMECVIDPANKSRVYGTLYYGDVRKSNDGGQSFSTSINNNQTKENADWIAPLVLDPNNSRIVYVGHQNIYRSTNYGAFGSYEKITDWNGQTLQNIAIAPSNSNVIYASTTSNLYASYDNGATWDNIYNSSTAITYIAVDHENPNRIWITKSGYSSSDKVWEYTGSEWKNISSNLPNVPINTIVHQEDSPDRLYIGTDVGVFYTDYNSAYWQRYGSGLPNVIVFELEINYTNNKLRAASYGRGMWEVDIDFCDIAQPQVQVSGPTEFCQGDSVEISIVGNYNDFEWSNGASTNSIVVKETGAYSVKIEDPNGCVSRSEAVFVNVYDSPDLEVSTSNDKMLCEGGTLVLRASYGFSSYEWSTGATTRTIEVDAPGEFWVTATTNEGCVLNSETFSVVYSIPEKPTVAQNGNTLVSTVEADRYQWYFEGDKIFGAVGRTYEMKEDESGEYMVEIYDASECNEISEPYSAVVSVNDLQDGEYVKVSPNPGNGLFNIDINILRGSTVNFEVIDLKGNVVYRADRISNNSISQIDLSNMPSGAYFMTISNNDFKYTEKLIKN